MTSSTQIQVLQESDVEKLRLLLFATEEKLASADAELELIMEEIISMDAFSQAISLAARKLGFPSSKHLIETINRIDTKVDPLENELNETKQRAAELRMLRQDLDTIEEKLRHDVDRLQSRFAKYKAERMVKDIIVDYLENQLL